MKRIFETFFAGMAFVAALAASPALADPLNVVVYGDSLVSGYQLQAPQAFPARLTEKMREVGYSDLNIINMSAEGMTSSMGVDRFNALMEKKPDVVIVVFGVDDIERGISVAQTYSNLAAIAGRLAQNGTYVILAGMKAPPTLAGGSVSQFNNMYRAVAIARRTMLVENILEGVADNPQLTLADNVHANARGVDVMVENVYRYVDSSVRTKLQAKQYEQEYKEYQENLARPGAR